MSTTAPSNGNERFNAEAATWDSNPDVHTASAGALKAILHHFPQLQQYRDGDPSVKGLDGLEIGCGTGILSLQLAPYLHSLTAVDTAPGMISALNTKLSQPPHSSSFTNVLPVCVLLTDPNDPAIQPSPLQGPTNTDKGDTENSARRFDIVFSHLVLHHIPDLRAVFSTMFGCLRPGGWVALTDFEDFGPQARKFHPEAKMEGVERHGIKRGEVGGLLREVGFEGVGIETGFVMEKEVEGGKGEGEGKGKMDFPFLLCVGRRP